MANDSTELRDILFATLRDLRKDKDPMDIERAKTISQVAQTAIGLAKVEIDHMKVIGVATNSSFLPAPIQPTTTGKLQVIAPPSPTGVVDQIIAANVTRHKCV